MTGRQLVAWVVTCLWLVPVASEAQSRSPARPGRLEVAAAAAWSGGHTLGAATADLLGNQVPRSSPTPLFTTSTELRPSVGVDAAIGYRLTQTLGVEGFVARSQPDVETTVTNDVELTAGASARESLVQYRVGGGLVLDLPAVAFLDGRVLPFVAGGAGYLREDSGNGTVSWTGTVYHLGAGLRIRLIERAGAPLLKAVGLRADVRIHRRDGGIDLEDRHRTFVTASVGLFLGL